MTQTLLDGLGAELSRILAPIRDAIDDPETLSSLLAEIGASSDAAGGEGLVTALSGVVDLANQIDHLVAQPSPSFAGIAAVLNASRQAIAAIHGLDAAAGPAAALEGLGVDLADLLIQLYLWNWHPLAYKVAVLATLIEPFTEVEPRPPVFQGGEILRLPFRLDHFRFNRLGALLSDPEAALSAEYGTPLTTVAEANAMADKLFPRVLNVLRGLGVTCRYGFDPADAPLLGDAATFVDHALIVYTADLLSDASAEAGAIFTLSSSDRAGLGLVVSPFGALTEKWQVNEWDLELDLTADVQAFAIGRHGITLLASPGTAEVRGKFTATLSAPSTSSAPSTGSAPSAGPAFILGAPNGTRLELGGAQLTAETTLSEAKQSLALSAAVSKSAIVIDAGDGDGFLQSVLPAKGARCEFDLGLAWSSDHGLTLKGAAGLDATLPAGLSVGPVSIQSIHVGLHAEDTGVSFECSATAGLSLGPLHVIVDRMGLLAGLAFPAQGANLGVADATLGFKPPSGLGLDIDAGVVTGGGFLGFDPANSEYRGAAQLSIEGVSLSALGLVQTHPEVSFLLLIAATFPTPIQLGLGFSLAGAGGIVGINRSISLDALETAVWKGTAKSLLFPSAPISDAAGILGTLDTIFPPAHGRYVFGPTARILWGSPTIITADVGLVIELPEPIRVALLGNAVAQFPLEKPIVVLKVSFAGGVDFGTNRLFFDASLSGSRIESYPISGDLSLRSSLSSPTNLALAVGGFNPHFQPPAGFPSLSRLALDISDGPLHLHLASYLAITTNTFQFGAAADLKAHVCDCDLAGHFVFDALFIKNPFSFMIEIDASASISFEGDTFAAIHVSGSLAGPAPWHAKGSASISLLFESVSVSFDHTWGSPPSPTLPPVDPWVVALAPALADPTSWKCMLPAGVHPVVTFAQTSGSGTTLLDPAGEIILDEKAVPLNQPIERFAETTLPEPLRFDLTTPSVNGSVLDPTDWTTITDEFAPAQFTDMTDDEKLSAESFVSLVSGMAIGGVAASVGTSVGAALTYDLIVLDSARQPKPRVPYLPTRALQIASASSGPSARVPWRVSGLTTFALPPGTSPKAALAPPAFAIVSTATLGVRASRVASTRYEAALALADYVAQHGLVPTSVEAVPQSRAA